MLSENLVTADQEMQVLPIESWTVLPLLYVLLMQVIAGAVVASVGTAVASAAARGEPAERPGPDASTLGLVADVAPVPETNLSAAPASVLAHAPALAR